MCRTRKGPGTDQWWSRILAFRSRIVAGAARWWSRARERVLAGAARWWCRAREHVLAGPRLGGRVLSLDVFRGVLIAAVVVLDVVGTQDHPHLAHATWDGYTVTDLVFPSLVVVSGVGLAFLLKPPTTLASVRRLVRRTIALLVLGVFLYNNLGSLDLAEVRYTGVLQMFAVAGMLAASVVLLLRLLGRGDRWWLGAGVALAGLFVYQGVWRRALVGFTCAAPDGRCSPFHALDVDVLGAAHVYRGGAAGWDPEGLVPSLAAAILMLAGWSVGVLVRDHRADLRRWPVVVGGAVVVGALTLWLLVPTLAADVEINKRLHTPALQALVIGYDLLVLGGLFVLFDATVAGRLGIALAWLRRGLAWPLETLGRNPLTVYLLAHLIGAAAAANARTSTMTWRDWMTDTAVSVADGVLWGDPLFNYAMGLLVVTFAVAVAMRLLGWRISL